MYISTTVNIRIKISNQLIKNFFKGFTNNCSRLFVAVNK